MSVKTDLVVVGKKGHYGIDKDFVANGYWPLHKGDRTFLVFDGIEEDGLFVFFASNTPVKWVIDFDMPYKRTIKKFLRNIRRVTSFRQGKCDMPTIPLLVHSNRVFLVEEIINHLLHDVKTKIPLLDLHMEDYYDMLYVIPDFLHYLNQPDQPNMEVYNTKKLEELLRLAKKWYEAVEREEMALEEEKIDSEYRVANEAPLKMD